MGLRLASAPLSLQRAAWANVVSRGLSLVIGLVSSRVDRGRDEVSDMVWPVMSDWIISATSAVGGSPAFSFAPCDLARRV